MSQADLKALAQAVFRLQGQIYGLNAVASSLFIHLHNAGFDRDGELSKMIDENLAMAQEAYGGKDENIDAGLSTIKEMYNDLTSTKE